MTHPTTAMIFAAGLGTRMRSHRSDIPKPLVPVAGKPMIDHTIDKLIAAGVQRVVVNVSYMGEMLAQHLARRSDVEILLSHEDEPLETGGGLVRARHLLGDAPFYLMNSDVGWLDGAVPMLSRLAQSYDADTEDCRLLVVPCERAHGYDGQGDFDLLEGGTLRRRLNRNSASHVFAGIQLMHPRLLERAEARYPVGTAFAFRELMEMDGDGTLLTMRGLEHDGEWMHIGDAEGVAQAEACLEKRSPEAA